MDFVNAPRLPYPAAAPDVEEVEDQELDRGFYDVRPLASGPLPGAPMSWTEAQDLPLDGIEPLPLYDLYIED